MEGIGWREQIEFIFLEWKFLPASKLTNLSCLQVFGLLFVEVSLIWEPKAVEICFLACELKPFKLETQEYVECQTLTINKLHRYVIYTIFFKQCNERLRN